MTRNLPVTAERGRISGRRSHLVAAAIVAVVAAGCNNILDVKNPNNVVEGALTNPGAATALANGAGATVTRALTAMYAPYGAVTDELTYVGSRDAYGNADKGEVADRSNEFSDAAYPYMSEARYTTATAVKLLKDFDSRTELADRVDLARAYLYEALIFTSIGEMFDDFVIESEKQTAGPPIGEGNMAIVFDSAVAQASAGLAIVQNMTSAAARDTRIRLLMVSARAKHSKAIWAKLNGTGGAPAATPVANPLVNDAGAIADATAALALIGATDYKFKFTPIPQMTAGFPIVGNDLNNRLELRAGDSSKDVPSTQCRDATCDQWIVPDATSGRAVASVKYQDPVTNIVDPVLSAIITECCIKGTQNGGGDYVPLTMGSAREMLLILAEGALAAGNTSSFTTYINQIRAFNSTLTTYNGSSPAPLDMLKHERFVNLFMQGRRLSDMHRFGIKAQKWVNTAAAYSKACFFPIMNTEYLTHPDDFVKPLCAP